MRTARNRAIDQLRRSARGRELHAQIDAVASTSLGPGKDGEDGAVKDDQLRLIFTCCHPALRTEHQVALTMRLLGGLRVDEMARSFLVSESAMAKRLVRAKYKIKAAKIPYRVPAEADLPERLRAVLSVLYLIYNTGVDDLERASLRGDSIRLARALVGLMPDEPEVAGLLALMLLSESRAPARTADGALVLLRDQDRTTWDRMLIDEGQAIVRACIRRNQPGPFQLQAAIQAAHCTASSFEATDWPQIVTLYDHLFSLMPTPVVALNRAIAVGEVVGPSALLDALDAIAPDLDNYHLMHAARGSALRQLRRTDAAKAAYLRAAHTLLPRKRIGGFWRKRSKSWLRTNTDRHGPADRLDGPTREDVASIRSGVVTRFDDSELALAARTEDTMPKADRPGEKTVGPRVHHSTERGNPQASRSASSVYARDAKAGRWELTLVVHAALA